MDLPSREKWYAYSRARDLMLKATDTARSPWHILPSDDKKRARLNCIRHILDSIRYRKVKPDKIKLPKRSMKGAYDEPGESQGAQVRRGELLSGLRTGRQGQPGRSMRQICPQ